MVIANFTCNSIKVIDLSDFLSMSGGRSVDSCGVCSKRPADQIKVMDNTVMENSVCRKTHN